MERRRVAGSPPAKNLIRCGLPRSRTSKSSAVRPVIGCPVLVGDNDAEVNEIDAGRNVWLLLPPRRDAIRTMRPRIAWAPERITAGVATSEDLVPADANHLRPERPLAFTLKP